MDFQFTNPCMYLFFGQDHTVLGTMVLHLVLSALCVSGGGAGVNTEHLPL